MTRSQEWRGDDAQVNAARLRLMLDHTIVSVVASALFALVLAWLIKDMGNKAWLGPWLGCKLATLVPRLLVKNCHSRTGHLSDTARWRIYQINLPTLALDGLVWGALVWGLTPIDHLNLAAITLTSLTGVAAVGVFVLSIDLRSLMAFLLPMLVPNVLFCLSRQDSIGVFGAASLGTFLLITVLGSTQVQRRIHEMLQLRFASERLAVERTQALEQARLHNEAKSRFLATVSHEMRTPLHGILGLARVLQQDQPRPEQRQKLALIESSGEHLLTVINDILDFSKIEAGRMDIESRPFDLSALLLDAGGVHQVLAQRKGLTFSLETAWAGPRQVVGDPGRLRQVLHNLLGNAVKFTEQGSVRLTARYLGNQAYEISVHDSGPGISIDNRERIFEAFTQAHSALNRLHGGTGLGLSIARQLCQAMGGHLVCESTPGQGSVFRATVVCPEPHAQPATSQAALRQPVLDIELETQPPDSLASDSGWWSANGAHVLLVEDNAVNIVVAEAVLNHLGCKVSTVTDGLQAIEWLDARQCDVVLMDCAMPVLDGFEATREIRRRESTQGRNRVPIVALTANAIHNEREHCLQSGMDDYISKPFTPEDVQRAIVRALNNTALLRSI